MNEGDWDGEGGGDVARGGVDGDAEVGKSGRDDAMHYARVVADVGGG